MKQLLKTILLFFVLNGVFQTSLSAITVPESAQGSAAQDHVSAKLVFDKNLDRVGVLFSIIPEWHIYWRNAGESGLETNVDFQGALADERRFEMPSIYLDPSKTINTFGFSTETLVWADVKKQNDDTEIRAKVSFLTCKVSCIPGSFEFVRKKSDLASPEEIAVFEKYAKKAPLRVQLPITVNDQIIERNAKTEIIVDVACDCEPAPRDNPNYYFIPDRDGIAQWKTTEVVKKEAGLQFKLSGQTSPDKIDVCSLRGVLPIVDRSGAKKSIWIDAPLKCADGFVKGGSIAEPEKKTEKTEGKTTEEKGEDSLLWFLLLAFIGGLILNLMPCVFPVLAIKVASLVSLSGSSFSKTLQHALAYVLGIEVSMIALAAIIVTLRSAGIAVGWGFQFQQPAFICIMFILLVAFAINLMGGFEILVSVGIKGNRSGLSKSFGEGVLSVVLATPCSAPILGSAVGFAFAGDPFEIFAIFIMIGLGLAAPFFLLALSPGWRDKLPKPGMWMIRLKQVLGVGLLATALWLLWVLVRATGWTSLALVLIWGALVVAALLYFGRHQFDEKKSVATKIVMAAGLLGIVATLVFPFQTPPPEPLADGWVRWSSAAVDQFKNNDRIIFVDFTADWCITCKVNENGVLKSKAVLDTFEKYKVVKMKGDWTRRDLAITKELSRHRRAGVPLYLVIGEGEQVLPELLTESIIIDAIQGSVQAKE